MEKPNLSYIKSLSGGDKSFEDKILSVMKVELLEEKNTYFNNFKKKKYVLVAENVHKIKHKISILGLEKCYEIATNYENNLREANVSLSEEFESILELMTNYLKQI